MEKIIVLFFAGYVFIANSEQQTSKLTAQQIAWNKFQTDSKDCQSNCMKNGYTDGYSYAGNSTGNFNCHCHKNSTNPKALFPLGTNFSDVCKNKTCKENTYFVDYSTVIALQI